MIYAQMVGKNESSRYLEDVLRRLSTQVDKIIFTDDCSDDNTAEIASKYCETFLSEKSMFKEHEGLFRQNAWSNLEKFARPGDWIVTIDADEKLFHLNNIPLASVLEHSPFDVVNVRFYHMWNETQYRVDKLWAPTNSMRIFRFRSDGKFLDKKLACGAEPSYVIDWLRKGNYWKHSGLIMQHLGYLRDEDKISKYERYKEIDDGKYHASNHIDSITDENVTLINWGVFGLPVNNTERELV